MSERVGDYQLLRPLGQGQSGTVSLARHIGSGRLVALKELHPGRQQEAALFREMSVLFGLDHPGVVRCLDLVYQPGSRSALVFEYADRGTLRDCLPLRLEEAESVLMQLSDALHYLHGRDVLHCDLKPDNVLMFSDGTCRLADFSVATRALAAAPSRGTPAYMAPEQFYDQPTAASDWYSLGVVLYEAVTGVPPFRGPVGELLHQHQQGAPDLSLIPPGTLRDAVVQLLARRPADRVPPRPSRAPEPALPAGPARRHAPGIERLYLGSDAVYLAASYQTDRWDPGSARYESVHLAEPIVAAAGLGFATPRAVYQWPGQRLFALPRAPIAVHVGRARVVYADDQAVVCASRDGTVRWRHRLNSYYLPPCLWMADDGPVTCSAGPTSPGAVTLADDGAVQVRHAADAPILALAGHARAVLMGIGRPARLVDWEDGWERPLPDAVYRARSEQGLLLLFDTSGGVHVCDCDGRPRWSRHVDGLIDAAMLPDGHLCVLSRQYGRTAVEVMACPVATIS